ncbi:MAG TPA: hypothetical protein VGX78_13485 [Pirellulales bacterium]|nr:hypothetical protein [Pirellulales bacterium]
MALAGYSGTPLAKKLGIKPGQRVFVEHSPVDYPSLVDPLPEKVALVKRLTGKVDLIHLFTRDAQQLKKKLAGYRRKIVENGTIWVSWPKKASKVPTDITEDVIRAVALPLGYVDVKVCAVDETWSGLKLVIRVENRFDV